ncbi:tetratricopeptide repeat protein, partial [Luteimonas deserti]
MNGLDAVHFARPAWLWLLLALPLLGVVWRLRMRAASGWTQAVDAHLLAHLAEHRAGRRGWLELAAWMTAGACAVLALAGPGWRQVPAPLQATTSPPLVVVLDLSTATAAADLPPSRLLQARAKLAELFAGRAEGETALVVYAGDAFTVAPLTSEAANLALYLDALAPDVMPADGQRADRGIEHAARLLRQRAVTRGSILLLTGQADRPAIAEAATASRMGYRVSVLGLGSPQGAAHRDAVGGLVHARLDEPALRALAEAGSGDYRRLTIGDADLRALRLMSDPANGDTASTGADRPGALPQGALRWADQGYWFILPLLVLVLLAFRRGAALAAVACLAALPMLGADARDETMRGTAWQRADQAVHGRLVEGVEAYRAGRYADAARHWADLPGPVAAYNRGNALARQGDLDGAIAAYDQALRLQPGMADALANRAAVEAARTRRPPPGPGRDPRAPPRGEQPDEGRPSPGA